MERLARAVEKPRIVPVIVRRAIEAWILADPTSLSHRLGVPVRVEEPERILDPAEELDRVMRRAGLRYVKGYNQAKALACVIDLESAAEKSESLRQFVNALKDC